MKPNHETIYLVPTDYDGGQLTYSWCDCPAPGEGMDPEDAIKYVRADLVPASNEVLARRVVELTNERDAALAQLVEVQDNRTGKAPCERFCEALATKKMFDNLQRHNQQLKAQVEQLLKPAKEAAEALGFASHHLRGRASENMLMDMAEKADALISAIGSTPAQCLAEIKAQAVINFADMIRGAYLAGFVPSDLNVYDVYQSARNHVKDNYKINIPAWDDQVANQLRQQAKGE
jgi:hypothetical protein